MYYLLSSQTPLRSQGISNSCSYYTTLIFNRNFFGGAHLLSSLVLSLPKDFSLIVESTLGDNTKENASSSANTSVESNNILSVPYY